MTHYDIIVIGGGMNSLVTASILGKSGKSVLLLEARNQIGGLASTTEFAPGFKCNVFNDVVKWIDPRVMKQLDLNAHGLELIKPDVVRIALGNEAFILHSTVIQNKPLNPLRTIQKKMQKCGKISRNTFVT